MSIDLVGIVDLGEDRFQLQFQDGSARVDFVLRRVPRKGSVVITREWSDHFWGRSSAREAIGALGRFARGEQVAFPIKVREDGFTGIGR